LSSHNNGYIVGETTPLRTPPTCHLNVDKALGKDTIYYKHSITISEFDSDDKKFITVAVVYENEHHQKATLLQSVDSQWYGSLEVFIENGLVVEFL